MSQLFGLAEDHFDAVSYIENEIEQLTVLYDIYQDYKTALLKWSAIPWSQLEVDVLTRGVDGFAKKLKELRTDLTVRPTFLNLRETITGFSEPLEMV